jgi:hypothetical protein
LIGGGLWIDHSGRTGLTQKAELLAMLRAARAESKPLTLVQIMGVGIAQHGARFNELRSLGFVIENELEYVSGRVHSRYYLRHDPEQDGGAL